MSDSAQWTSERVRTLRGRRTLEEFGSLLRVPKNTVWRWESGYVHPAPDSARRLSRLAKKEKFLVDWTLKGSATLLGDLEEGSKHLAHHLQFLPGRATDLVD